MSHLNMVISFVNRDGGAGKTTIPASLATILANPETRNKRILLVDCSPKCSLTKLFLGKHIMLSTDQTLYATLMHNQDIVLHDTAFDNIKLVAGHDQLNEIHGFQYEMFLRYKIEQIKGQWDYIFIDTFNDAGETANGTLSNAAICASEQVVIVMKPSRDSYEGATAIVDQLNVLKDRQGIDITIKSVILNKVKYTRKKIRNGDEVHYEKQPKRIALQCQGELENHEVLTRYYKERYDIPYNDTVNDLQYNYGSIGLKSAHIAAAKKLQLIADELF